MKKGYCESCGKHPVAYFCNAWDTNDPVRRICCVCADTMIARIPNVKEVLNIKEIEK
jgi:hypothetical protein